MNTRFEHRKIAAAAAAVVAVASLAGAAVAASGTETAPTPELVDRSAIAGWAQANGLTGLSPASLATATTPEAAYDHAAVAAWAQANGLTGLSPASLRPAED